jgi:hypothetical protein
MMVTNASTGRIIGNAVSGADGDAIDIDRLAAIDNSGAITALGLSAGPNLNEAIAIGGGSILNRVGGTIVSDQRAITVDDSNLGNAFGAVTLSNEGTIAGLSGEAVRVTGIESNTLTNKGTINGSVVLGNGADTMNLYAGSLVNGLLDGGGGSDTLHLLGAGAGTLGSTSNIETYSFEGGSWTLDGATGETWDMLILNGGDLILGGGSLYVSELVGALISLSGDTLTNITGNGFNVYYAVDDPVNAYLQGKTYALNGEGSLIAVPEPQSIALVLCGLVLIVTTRRREALRRRGPKEEMAKFARTVKAAGMTATNRRRRASLRLETAPADDLRPGTRVGALARA